MHHNWEPMAYFLGANHKITVFQVCMLSKDKLGNKGVTKFKI